MPNRLLATFVLLAAALPAAGQQREVELFSVPNRQPALVEPRPPEPETTPGTYRDLAVQGIDIVPAQPDALATTKIEKFSRWDRGSFTKRERRAQYQQQIRLSRGAEKFANHPVCFDFLKTVGVLAQLADSPTTVMGHISVGNFESASVAAVDEAAKGYLAAQGAWAFGKAGAAVGTFFGGPPGAMLGGAAGAIVGALATTAGYNAFVSPTVTGATEALIEMGRSPAFVEALRNREAFLIAEALRAREWELELKRRECFLVAAPPDHGEVLRADPSAAASTAATQPDEEQVLLNLPRDFDVRLPEMDTSGPHGNVVYVTDEPCTFRFRGEQVSGGWQTTVKWDNDTERGESIHRYKFEGTFRRGVFAAEGTNSFLARTASKELSKSWTRLKLHGRANADGVLSIEVEQIPIRYVYEASGQWKEDENWVKSFPAEARKWRAPIVLKLPVGELQSSQTLTPAPGWGDWKD